MAQFPVAGLAASDPTPGVYVEINFGVGPASGFAGQYGLLLIGNKTSAGSMTVDTSVYQPQSESDAIALAGPGSELHRMYRRATSINKTTPVFMLAPTESTGSAATGTITFATTGASATGPAAARIWIGDESVDVSISTGDAPTAIAAAAVIQINNKTHLPVTASASSGVVTITAKNKGPRGNEIRYRATIIGSAGTTVTPAVSTACSGGTTSDDWTTALATIAPSWYYYLVPASGDSTGNTLTPLATQVATQATATVGLRQKLIVGFVGTRSNGSTLAAALNVARADVLWQEQSEWTSAEVAAHAAAGFAVFDDVDPSYNYDGFGDTPQTTAFWQVPAQSQMSYWPNRSVILTALNNGLTPIQALPNGRSKIVMRCTTKHKNGTNFDYRVRDSHIVTVEDRFADDAVVRYQTRFSGKKLAADPIQGQPVQDASVISPRVVKAMLSALVEEYYAKGRLKNLQTILDGIQVIIDDQVQTRCSARVPLQVINLAHQFTLQVNDTSSAVA